MRVTFPMALGLLFLALRLTGYIAWSWWWVLLPFYGPLAVALVCYLAVVPFEGWGWYARDQRRAAFIASRRRS